MKQFINNLGIKKEWVKVFLITGQSNALGDGDNGDATSEELQSHPLVKIWNTSASAFQNLQIGVNNMSASGKHGIELNIGAYSEDYYPGETIYLIKYAVGSTSITEHIPGGSIYNTYINSYVVPAINSLINEGKSLEVFMCWQQGETDLNTPEGESYKYVYYPDRFDYWVDLWKYHFNNGLCFGIAEIGDNWSTIHPAYYINDVFHNKAVTEPNMIVTDNKDLSTIPPINIHFDYTALKNISDQMFSYFKGRIGARIINTIDNSIPSTPVP